MNNFVYYLIKIKAAKYLGDYKIWCLFSTGEEKIVDLENELYGQMFEPLKDKNIFMQFKVDDELKTIVWTNGADLAPYSLYDLGKEVPKRFDAKKKVTGSTKRRSVSQKKKRSAVA